MFKLKNIKAEEVHRYKISELFPDVTEELKCLIEAKAELKRGILNHMLRDTAGHQFNAIRLCSVPEDYKPYEEEVEELEDQLDTFDDDDNRRKVIYKQIKKLERKIKKLKDPHKFLDTVCESYKCCPLYRNGTAPEGCSCPFEYKLVCDWTEGYLSEFEIDITKQGADKSLISQLVVSDLIIYRCMKAIASTSLIDVGEKMSQFGLVYEKQVNAYLDIKEKEAKNKLKILNNMIGTRADKKRFKVEDKKSAGASEKELEMAKVIKEKESIRKTGMKTLIDIPAKADDK